MSSEEDNYDGHDGSDSHDGEQQSGEDDGQHEHQSPTQQIKAAAGVSLSESTSQEYGAPGTKLPPYAGSGSFNMFNPPGGHMYYSQYKQSLASGGAAFPAGPHPSMMGIPMPPMGMVPIPPMGMGYPPQIPFNTGNFFKPYNPPTNIFANGPNPQSKASGIYAYPALKQSESVLSNNSQDDSNLLFPGLVKPPQPQSVSSATDEALAQKATHMSPLDLQYESFKQNHYVEAKNPKLAGSNSVVCCFTHTEKYKQLSKEEVRMKAFNQGPNSEGFEVNEGQQQPIQQLGSMSNSPVSNPQSSGGVFGGLFVNKPSPPSFFGGSPINLGSQAAVGPPVKLLMQTGGLFGSNNNQSVDKPQPEVVTQAVPHGLPIPQQPQTIQPPAAQPAVNQPTNKLHSLFSAPQQQAPNKPSFLLPSGQQSNLVQQQSNKGELTLSLTSSDNTEVFSMTTTDDWKVQAVGENDGVIQLSMVSAGTTFKLNYKKGHSAANPQPSVPYQPAPQALPNAYPLTLFKPIRYQNAPNLEVPANPVVTVQQSGQKSQQNTTQSPLLFQNKSSQEQQATEAQKPFRLGSNHDGLMSEQHGEAVSPSSPFFNQPTPPVPPKFDLEQGKKTS